MIFRLTQTIFFFTITLHCISAECTPLSILCVNLDREKDYKISTREFVGPNWLRGKFMATQKNEKNTVCMYFWVLHALCRINRQNKGSRQYKCSKDEHRENWRRRGMAGSKKKHISTQERGCCSHFHFYPNNKPTKKPQTYSPSVIRSRRITW